MRWGAIIVGYIAVAVLIGVSMTANGFFASSLGSTEFERNVFIGASLAVDAYKALGLFFIVCMFMYRPPGWTGFWSVLPWAFAALLVWAACFAWSTASAIGFAAVTRGDVVTTRTAEEDERGAATARVRRIEAQLAWAPAGRPAAVIEADIKRHDGVDVTVWVRTKGCVDVTKTESEKACEPVAALRAELVGAKEAARLEGELATARAELVKAGGAIADEADPQVAGKEAEARADPQAAALATLASIAAGEVRLGLGLLLAALIEALSALGFTIVSLAARRRMIAPPPPPASTPWWRWVFGRRASHEGSKPAPTGASQSPTTGALQLPPTKAAQVAPTGVSQGSPIRAAQSPPTGAAQSAATGAAQRAPPRALQSVPTGASQATPARAARSSPASATVVEAWAASRLVKQRNGRLPAHQAFEDFSDWCIRNGYPVPTVQVFGKGMTNALRAMGGSRREVNGRPVYSGIVLATSALRLVGGAAAP